MVRFVFSAVVTFLPSPSDAESLKNEMKRFAAQLPDSQFLSQLKSIDDVELLPIMQDVETIAHSLLSSLIDETVESMTHKMAVTQQEHYNRAIQDKFRIEELELRNKLLVEFIQGLNAQSAGHQDW